MSISRPSIVSPTSLRKKPLSAASVSNSRKCLLRWMQALHFGRIEQLIIVDAEPQVDPPPLLIREVKFASDPLARTERIRDEYLLKRQILELFAFFDQVQSTTIPLLTIKHGLPFLMEYQEHLL